jgi:hypothetical protein
MILRLGTLFVLLATGCNACEPVQPLSLGEQCQLNSDCDAPLVCRFDRCRIECATSRDCGINLDCLYDNAGLGACMLGDETMCTMPSDCVGGLICPMGRCTTVCATDEDCGPGQRCIDGSACVDPNQQSCIYSSQCPDGTVCAYDERCREECLDERDCRWDLECGVVEDMDGMFSRVCHLPRFVDGGP